MAQCTGDGGGTQLSRRDDPGAILTTTNIADLKPYPVILPPPAAPPVSSTKLPIPVGKRFTFSNVETAIGDLFSPLVDLTGSDGYIDGDTWTELARAMRQLRSREKVPGIQSVSAGMECCLAKDCA